MKPDKKMLVAYLDMNGTQPPMVLGMVPEGTKPEEVDCVCRINDITNQPEEVQVGSIQEVLTKTMSF